MERIVILLVGVLLSSLAFGQTARQSEERYKAKLGRYSPAEEKRQSALAGKTKSEFVEPSCCPRKFVRVMSVSEAVLAAKHGRNSRAFEFAQEQANTEVRAHAAKCIELSRCPIDRVKTPPTAAPSETETRLQAKLGIAAPGKTHTSDTAAQAHGPALRDTGSHAPCTEPCCHKAE
jgi:hypothetical protein